MADSTLSAIITKVRRLTRSPSPSQITDAQIKEYVNTFVLYDMPSQLRLFSLRKTFTFWTIPNVDTYQTNNTYANSPFYQFQDKYISVHDPVYIGGFRAYYTQSRDEFFGMWPMINLQQLIAQGDGVTSVFSTVPVPATGQPITQPPFLLNNVTFSAISATNGALTLHDVPVVDATGNPTMDGNLYVPGFEPLVPPTVIDPVNTVNYLTGAYTVTFKNDQNVTTPPANIATPTTTSINQGSIWIQVVPYQASIPTTLLYYNNQFTVRPVPTISYPVNVEVYVRPTELINTGDSPQLQQWWQYLAVGAAKKIFEDRMDMDSVQQVLPLFKEQEMFVLRTTLVQEENQRASTIYAQQASLSANQGGWWVSGGGI